MSLTVPKDSKECLLGLRLIAAALGYDVVREYVGMGAEVNTPRTPTQLVVRNKMGQEFDFRPHVNDPVGREQAMDLLISYPNISVQSLWETIMDGAWPTSAPGVSLNMVLVGAVVRHLEEEKKQ